MTELAIISASEIATIRSAAWQAGAAGAKLENALLSLRDENGKYSRVSEANYKMLRDEAMLAFIAGEHGIGSSKVGEASIAKARELLKADKNADDAFRQRWSRACKRVNFPVFGKNAGNANASGNTKAAGEKAKPDAGKDAEKAAAEKNAVATTAAKIASNTKTAKDLDSLFRQTANTLRNVCIKRGKMSGIAQYAALAEEFYSKVMALEVPNE